MFYIFCLFSSFHSLLLSLYSFILNILFILLLPCLPALLYNSPAFLCHQLLLAFIFYICTYIQNNKFYIFIFVNVSVLLYIYILHLLCVGIQSSCEHLNSFLSHKEKSFSRNLSQPCFINQFSDTSKLLKGRFKGTYLSCK